MRRGHLLFSAVQFLFTLFFAVMSFWFLWLAYSPYAWISLQNYLAGHPALFFVLGYGSAIFTVVLLISFYAMNKKVYYKVQMNAQNALVNSSIFEAYVEQFWKEEFPELICQSEVLIHGDERVEILTSIGKGAHLLEEKQLKHVEAHLGRLLFHKIGYRGDFTLTIIPIY